MRCAGYSLRLAPAPISSSSYIGDESAEAKPRLKEGFAEADRDGVFGVPTFVIDGERFWGYDRMDWLTKKLDAMGLRR